MITHYADRELWIGPTRVLLRAAVYTANAEVWSLRVTIHIPPGTDRYVRGTLYHESGDLVALKWVALQWFIDTPDWTVEEGYVDPYGSEDL